MQITKAVRDFARERGEARYNWFDNGNCACAQFFNVGRDWLPNNEEVLRSEGVNLNEVAWGDGKIDEVKTVAEREMAMKGWTFNQFADRLDRKIKEREMA